MRLSQPALGRGRPIAAWLAVPGLLLLVAPARAAAEVTRIEITERADLPASDYERLAGRVHFAVDPIALRNRAVVDLDKATRAPSGRVEFSADFHLLRPKSGESRFALVDIVNRGRLTYSRYFAPGAADPAAGDRFFMSRRVAVAAVGWEFDIPDERIRVLPPVASENGDRITGLVRARFTPDRAAGSLAVSDLAGYAPLDPEDPASTLGVVSGNASAAIIPRDRWRVSSANVVSLAGGFEPGRTYEITYRAANPPVAGVGFLAVRDVASWIRQGAGGLVSTRYVYTFGASQSGRFLRDFLYQGFNADEENRQVFDGVVAHIAGAARMDLNRRWATPVSATSAATPFPFADRAMRDPVSGATDGLLDNDRAREHQPKVFYTNTSVEYWSSAGRAAALIHTTPDGTRDVPLQENTRTYLFASTQHGPGTLPAEPSAGQQRANPTDYTWILRALLIAMDQWVRDGVDPPPSQYPRLDGQMLVDVQAVAFPAIPGVQSPRGLRAGPRVANPMLPDAGGGGAPLPLLVPQVDRDGNERAGIRLPEVEVPLATYTGWNFRSAAIGGTDQLVALLGSYIPFARTRADRERRGDPRPAIEERYSNRADYLSRIRSSAGMLIKGRYVLPEDAEAIIRRAGQHWDLATEASGATASAR
jgi:hypothetical protein